MQIHYKRCKKKIKKSSEIHLEKDIKIAQLQKQLKEVNGPISLILFERFENNFNKAEMKMIRSIRSGQSRDSSFVLCIMKAHYKDNEIQKLYERSVTGKKQKGKTKNAITPPKKNIIEQMLKERLASEVEDNDETIKRLAALNRLIRHSIVNILKRLKQSKNTNHQAIHKVFNSASHTIQSYPQTNHAHNFQTPNSAAHTIQPYSAQYSQSYSPDNNHRPYFNHTQSFQTVNYSTCLITCTYTPYTAMCLCAIWDQLYNTTRVTCGSDVTNCFI